MSRRVRFAVLTAALGLAVLVGTVPAAGARGPQQPTIVCTQAGTPVDTVAAGSQFAVSGSGFRPDIPVLVCFNEAYCLHSDVGRDGDFYQGRTLSEAGRYAITVKQARNRQLDRWDLKATAEITISE